VDTGRIIIYDETNGAELASAAFTATALRQRFTIQATSAVGQISTSVRIEIDTNGEGIYAWEAGIVQGQLSSAIPTTSVVVSRAKTAASLTNTTGNTYAASGAGEIQIVCALNEDVSASVRTLLDVNDGATNNDRILIEVLANGKVQARIWDSAAALKQTVTANDPGNWDQEHTVRLRWDSAKGVDGNAQNADLVVDGVRTAGAVATWTAGAGATKIEPGVARGANHADGVLATISIWNGPRVLVP